ncbi:MAG: hypothetical protein AB1468_00655, partial [Candidatus Micrarchaeota archaeon]
MGLKFPLALVLCLLAGAGAGSCGRVALVVSFEGADVLTRCVGYSGSASAADILQNSGLGVVILEDPVLGKALCKIGGVGCGADDCFGCNSPYYWGF